MKFKMWFNQVLENIRSILKNFEINRNYTGIKDISLNNNNPDYLLGSTKIQVIQSDVGVRSDTSLGIKPSQRALYLDLFLKLLDSVFLIDKDTYQIIEVNDAGERLTGVKSEDLVGILFQQLIHSEDQEEASKKLRISRRKYYPLEFEARLISSQNQIGFLRISSCSLKLVDGTEVIQVIAKDITAEKDAANKINVYMGELQELNRKLEELSITDELTKLSNVRHFKNRLKEEHNRVVRYKGTYSVILFDVDNFKHYNDSHGHPAGDQLLRTLGRLIKENTRSTDLPARYGGEEFVILCPETTEAGAVVSAEKYRKIIEAYPFEHAAEQPLGRVSVSIGVASFPGAGQDAEDIVKAADLGLYQSKESGRNRVTAFTQVSDSKEKKSA